MKTEYLRLVGRRIVVLTIFVCLPIAALWIRTASTQVHLLLAFLLVVVALGGLVRVRVLRALSARSSKGSLDLVAGTARLGAAAGHHSAVDSRSHAGLLPDYNQSCSVMSDAPTQWNSEMLTEAIFQSSVASIIITDPNGRIVRLNPAAARLTLINEQEALAGKYQTYYCADSRTARLVTPTAAPDSAACTPQSTQSLRKAGHRSEGHEWTYIRRGESSIPVNIFVHPLRSTDGQVSGYVETAVELTGALELYKNLDRLANHDQLTGLANRSLLFQRLEQLTKRIPHGPGKMALFVFGVDNFRRINESLGHDNGDILLKRIAAQLESSVRSSDLVARVGGDEFAVLMPDFRSFKDAERCAHLMLQAIAEPLTIADCEVRITASVGFCVYPDAAETAADLLLRADIAMHEAKAKCHNSCCSFSPEMHKEATQKLELENELRHALKNGELSLYYQPQIDCGSNLVVGMEVLLRWNNRKRGYIPPNVFIPIAEKAGLLTAMGEWSLRKACKDSMLLQAELGRPLMLAINLSPSQLCHADLLHVLQEALEESDLPARQLEIEITEQVLMTTQGPVMQTLRALRDVGVKVALDDFGTGYSSFSYIMQYHFDRLKIDRSFVSRSSSDPTAAAIVRTIIAMAHGMNLEVVAEGVETTDQLNFLVRRKCDEVQGFLFSQAVPASQFSRVVRIIERNHPSKACTLSDTDALPATRPN